MNPPKTCSTCTGPRDAIALICPFCGAVFEESDRRPTGERSGSLILPPSKSPAATVPPLPVTGSQERKGSEDQPAHEEESEPDGPTEAGTDSELNPYLPPTATVATRPQDSGEAMLPARRFSRLAAQCCNTLLLFLVYLPFGIIFEFESEESGVGYVILVVLCCLVPIFLIIFNLIYLRRDGQSLGKKVVKIRIVRSDNTRVGLGRLIFLRYLPTNLLLVIPFLGPFLRLLDILTIFGGDSRCIHDFIADTKVVQVMPATK